MQESVGINANGTFSGAHRDGDILLVVDFNVGGSTPSVATYRWTGTDASGGLTALHAPAGTTFAFVNSEPVSVPWPFLGKFGHTSPQAGQFILVGLDLTALFGDNAPRVTSFLAETRSSTSTTSTLSDFALGPVNTIGIRYTVEHGPYGNTVTVIGRDQGTGTVVFDTNTNYHVGQGESASPRIFPDTNNDRRVNPFDVLSVIAEIHFVNQQARFAAEGEEFAATDAFPPVEDSGSSPTAARSSLRVDSQYVRYANDLALLLSADLPSDRLSPLSDLADTSPLHGTSRIRETTSLTGEPWCSMTEASEEHAAALASWLREHELLHGPSEKTLESDPLEELLKAWNG